MMSKSTLFPCLVIGIGGVTNGGKTTLCQKICKSFGDVSVFCMDDYYYPDGHPNMTLLEEFDNYANWDELAAVNVDAMTKDVKLWKENHQSEMAEPCILLVEGILILNHGPLVEQMDLKYFLTLSKEECWRRRSCRTYDPPEPPGYFERICWPMYLQYLKQLEQQNDIVYLCGEENQDKTYQQIIQDIQKAIEVGG